MEQDPWTDPGVRGPAAACAPAMSAPQDRRVGSCRIVNAEKLPAEAGGADAICSAIEQAIAARAPNVRYSAEVRVLSKSVGERECRDRRTKLPEQNIIR